MTDFDSPVIGVSINNVTEFGANTYGLKDLLRAGREAEAMGYDAVWVHDAPLGRRTLAAHDPVTVLAAIAGVTKTIRLGTGIIAPHLRNPVMLAQQWATLATLSDNRAIFGVGTGAGTGTLIRREFDAMAALRHDTKLDPKQLYERRGALFDESLTVIRRLWSEDKFAFKGEFYQFDELTLGEARPDKIPPVLVGAGIYFPEKPGAPVHHGWVEKNAGKFVLGPYKRVAALGEGWMTVHATPEEYEASFAKIKAHADAEHGGRRIAKAYNCFVNVDDDPVKAKQAVKDHLTLFHGPPVWDDVVERWAFAGTPEQIAERIRKYTDIGVTVFQLVIGSPDQFTQMRLFAEKVLPLLRRR